MRVSREKNICLSKIVPLILIAQFGLVSHSVSESKNNKKIHTNSELSSTLEWLAHLDSYRAFVPGSLHCEPQGGLVKVRPISLRLCNELDSLDKKPTTQAALALGPKVCHVASILSQGSTFKAAIDCGISKPNPAEHKLTAFQKSEMLQSANKIKEQMSKWCCGTDLRCKKIYSNIKVRVAEPYGSLAAEFWGGSNPDLTDEEYFKERTNAITSIRSGNLAGAIAGQITLKDSFDTTSGTPEVSEQVIRHEFVHACLNIQMQIYALKVTPTKLDTYVAAFIWLKDPTDETMSFYKTFLKEKLSLSKECIDVALVESQFSCQSEAVGNLRRSTANIEEMVAFLGEFLTADPLVNYEYSTHVLCDVPYSTQHPMGVRVLQCLLKDSPAVRKNLRKAFYCS